MSWASPLTVSLLVACGQTKEPEVDTDAIVRQVKVELFADLEEAMDIQTVRLREVFYESIDANAERTQKIMDDELAKFEKGTDELITTFGQDVLALDSRLDNDFELQREETNKMVQAMMAETYTDITEGLNSLTDAAEKSRVAVLEKESEEHLALRNSICSLDYWLTSTRYALIAVLDNLVEEEDMDTDRVMAMWDGLLVSNFGEYSTLCEVDAGGQGWRIKSLVDPATLSQN